MSQQASPNSWLAQHLQLIFSSTGMKRIVALFLVSILVTLWIANSSVTAESLFQSPESPVAPPPTQPPPTQPPPTQPPPTQPPPTQPPPTEPPPVEQPPTEPPPAEQPPAEQPPAEQPPVDQPATTEPATPTPQPTDTQTIAPEQPTPSISRPPRSRSDQDMSGEDGDASNLILDEAEFIDTVVVSGAYVWLCCGVILFLLVPIFMLILYIRGRSKVSQDRNF